MWLLQVPYGGSLLTPVILHRVVHIISCRVAAVAGDRIQLGCWLTSQVLPFVSNSTFAGELLHPVSPTKPVTCRLSTASAHSWLLDSCEIDGTLQARGSVATYRASNQPKLKQGASLGSSRRCELSTDFAVVRRVKVC